MSRRCPAPEARAKAEEEFRRRNSVTTSSDEQGTCTWTWTGTEWVTACGAQTRDFGLIDFKFCPFCGKSLAEAVKENDK